MSSTDALHSIYIVIKMQLTMYDGCKLTSEKTTTLQRRRSAPYPIMRLKSTIYAYAQVLQDSSSNILQ